MKKLLILTIALFGSYGLVDATNTITYNQICGTDNGTRVCLNASCTQSGQDITCSRASRR